MPGHEWTNASNFYKRFFFFFYFVKETKYNKEKFLYNERVVA